MKKILICILVIHIFLTSTVLNAFAMEGGAENDTFSTATAISVNQSNSGSLQSESDVNWYKFEVYESGYFYVELQTPVSKSPKNYWKIGLYDSNNSDLCGSTLSRATVAEEGSTLITGKYGISPGVYYIKISKDTAHSDGIYKINVKFTAAYDWETENNSTRGKANLLEFDAIKYGSATSEYDEDWYKFNVTSNSYVAIEFSHEAIDKDIVYWKFWIQNSRGVNIHKDLGLDSQGRYEVKGNEDVTTHVYYLPTGTYYIKITGAPKENTATYSLKVFYGNSSNYSTEKICIDSGHVVRFGHDNPYWRDVDKATCTASGTREYYCDRCNVSIKTERVNATGHVAAAWQDVVKPTCLASGIRQRVCEHCGILMEEEVVPETGHIYTDDDWVVVSGNKLIPPIIRERVCHSCEYVDRQEIWDYVWVPIVTLVAVVAVALGLINYIRAFLKKS